MDINSGQTHYNHPEKVETVNQNLLLIQRHISQKVGSGHFNSSSFTKGVDMR